MDNTILSILCFLYECVPLVDLLRFLTLKEQLDRSSKIPQWKCGIILVPKIIFNVKSLNGRHNITYSMHNSRGFHTLFSFFVQRGSLFNLPSNSYLVVKKNSGSSINYCELLVSAAVDISPQLSLQGQLDDEGNFNFIKKNYNHAMSMDGFHCS